MITRISAALFALYLVHGSENVARDSAALADQARKDAPSAIVGLCTDHAQTCQDMAMKAVSTKLGASMPIAKEAPPPRTGPCDQNTGCSGSTGSYRGVSAAAAPQNRENLILRA